LAAFLEWAQTSAQSPDLTHPASLMLGGRGAWLCPLEGCCLTMANVSFCVKHGVSYFLLFLMLFLPCCLATYHQVERQG
jgi:hypothetical protein